MGRVDFVVTQWMDCAGYISTNLKHQIIVEMVGDKRKAIKDIRDNYPNHVFTFKDIFPMADDERAFTDIDEIYRNKLNHRLERLSYVKRQDYSR